MEFVSCSGWSVCAPLQRADTKSAADALHPVKSEDRQVHRWHGGGESLSDCGFTLSLADLKRTQIWGVVSMCMAACNDFAGLAAVRFFLGVLEAGLLPCFMVLNVSQVLFRANA